MLIIDPIPLPSDLAAGLLAVLVVAIVVGVAIAAGVVDCVGRMASRPPRPERYPNESA